MPNKKYTNPDLIGEFMSTTNSNYDNKRDDAFKRAQNLINHNNETANEAFTKPRLLRIFGPIAGVLATLTIITLVAPGVLNPFFGAETNEKGEIVSANPFKASDVIAYYEELEEADTRHETVTITTDSTETLRELITTKDDEEYVLIQNLETEEIITETLVEAAGEDKLISDNEESKNHIVVEQTEGLYCSSQSSFEVVKNLITSKENKLENLDNSEYAYEQIVEVLSGNPELKPISEDVDTVEYQIEGWKITADKETAKIISATSDSDENKYKYEFGSNTNANIQDKKKNLEPVNDKMLTPNGEGCYVESEEVDEELSQTYIDLEAEKETKIAKATTEEEVNKLNLDYDSIITEEVFNKYIELSESGLVTKGNVHSIANAERYGISLNEQLKREERIIELTDELTKQYDAGEIDKGEFGSQVGAVREGLTVSEFEEKEELRRQLAEYTSILYNLGLADKGLYYTFESHSTAELQAEVAKYKAIVDAELAKTSDGQDTSLGYVTGTLTGRISGPGMWYTYEGMTEEPFWDGWIEGGISPNLTPYLQPGNFLRIYPEYFINQEAQFNTDLEVNVTHYFDTGLTIARSGNPPQPATPATPEPAPVNSEPVSATLTAEEEARKTYILNTLWDYSEELESMNIMERYYGTAWNDMSLNQLEQEIAIWEPAYFNGLAQYDDGQDKSLGYIYGYATVVLDSLENGQYDGNGGFAYVGRVESITTPALTPYLSPGNFVDVYSDASPDGAPPIGEPVTYYIQAMIETSHAYAVSQ